MFQLVILCADAVNVSTILFDLRAANMDLIDGYLHALKTLAPLVVF